MVTEKELFAAVRLIKEYCKEQDKISPNSCINNDYKCPLWSLCFTVFRASPIHWPDPAEGGTNDG